MHVGGDEFIVVMQGDVADSVFDFAEKLREAVESLAIPMVDDAYRKQYPDPCAQSVVKVSVGAILMTCMERRAVASERLRAKEDRIIRPSDANCI